MTIVVESALTISVTRFYKAVCLERPKLASRDRPDHFMILAFERALQLLNLGGGRLSAPLSGGIRHGQLGEFFLRSGCESYEILTVVGPDRAGKRAETWPAEVDRYATCYLPWWRIL